MNHWKHLCRLSLWLSNPVIELYKENVWSSQCQEIRVENLKNDLITATIGEDTEFTHNYHPQEFPKIVFPWFSGKNPRDGGAQWLFLAKNLPPFLCRARYLLGRLAAAVLGPDSWSPPSGSNASPVVCFSIIKKRDPIYPQKTLVIFFHVFKQVWCDDMNISDGCHCFHGEIPIVLHSNPTFSWSNHTFCTFCCLCRAVVHATSVSTGAMAVRWPEKWWTDRDFTKKT